MDTVWKYTFIALGVYVALFIADWALKKYKARKVAKLNDRSTSNSPVGASTTDE